MSTKILTALTAAAMLAGSVAADIIAQGLELGSKAQTTFSLVEASSDQDLITLQVQAEDARDMKGYGFIVSFDPERFEYVEAEEPLTSMISPSGTDALLLARNHESGRVAVGAIQVDGTSASGEGSLVDLTFRSIDGSGFGDFRLLEGVVVDLAGQATSVASSILDNVGTGPTDYGLNQNVPNPFNPETTISYQLPESGRVLLTVYTSLGQEVRTLVDEVQEIGQYTIRWDGRDAAGRQVASGVYFYKMAAENFGDTKRMMLLK
jgi:hypothetical protein